MRIEQLAYFVSISETKSISQTSTHFFTSHQAVSTAIKRLEQEVGTILLNRSKTGVSLTTDGEILLEKAKQIASLHKDIMEHFNPPNSKVQTTGTEKLTIFATPRIIDTFLSSVVQGFLESNPKVHLSLKSMEPSLILTPSNLNKANISLLASDQSFFEGTDFLEILSENRLKLNVFLTEELFICLNKYSKWSKKDCFEESDFTPPSSIPVVGFEYNLTERGHNYSPFQITSMDSQRRLINDKLGVAIITEREFKNYYSRNKSLILKKFNHPPLCFVYITRDDTTEPPIVNNFLKRLTKTNSL